MRTSKDAIHGVVSLPGISPSRKRTLVSSTIRKDVQNVVSKNSNSTDSNSENILPSKRRKRKSQPINKPMSPNGKVNVIKIKDRKTRKNRNLEQNSSVDESDTLSSPDQRGVNESFEQSALNESSILNSSNENGIDESQRKPDITLDTPNSSIVTDGDEDGDIKRKLRSGRNLIFTPLNGKSEIDNQNTVLKDSSENVILCEPIEDVAEQNSDTNNVSDIFKHAQQEQSETTSAEKKVESGPVVNISEEFNIHSEKASLISLENNTTTPIVNIKSPSAVSIDSAKGSSIANDSDCTIFATGDLYWGRIHNFSYWACMICPDDSDDDNLITRLIDHQMEVHVRFFADYARHSWVKRENLILYQGLESYREHLRELKEKFGIKSIKYQSFLPKRTKLKTWLEAVKEADIIATIPYAERMEKFFELNNIARERNKEERMRRKSICLPQTTKNLSDNGISEISDQFQNTAKKRNRSESPISPAFSPIRKVKRRKTTADATELMITKQKNGSEDTPRSKRLETEIETEYNSSLESRNIDKNQIIESPQFHQFHAFIKDFVMQGARSEFVEQNLFVAVKNIWDLKHILAKQLEQRLTEKKYPKDQHISQYDTGEKALKRLSVRLKDMQERERLKTLSPPMATTTTDNEERRRLSSISKPRKVTRPIEEVIDDIFNLDNRYLFDNMGRDPVCKYCHQPGGDLRRCSKGCLNWLHRGCIESPNLSTSTSPIKGNSVSVKKRPTKRESVAIAPISTSSRPVLHVTADTDENGNENISKSGSESEDKVLEGLIKEVIKEPIVCKECSNNEPPKCFVCQCCSKTQVLYNGEAIEEKMIACNMAHCGRFYHPSCLKYWPQSKITKSKNSIVSFRCPSHVCHTCVSDDPKGKFQHLNNANTTKCVKCPATYHMDSTCIPAGSQILTAAHIICPRHGLLKSDQHVNVSWCFICVRGGQLICCETCPTAVHAECSNIALDSSESYICDECESGRMPLYGEMVWAKFNAYRWWPAIILPPTEVPLNIQSKTHNPFEFVIRFFGTHDHGWISRRRVYLYLEGDWSEPPRTKKSIDQKYLRGVIEAKEAYEMVKERTLMRVGENENKEKLHPQPYIKIRVNRAVPPVKLHPSLENVSKCECNPEEENPCGPETNCLNRVLYHECNPKICPAGERCQNQMFEARNSPSLEIFYAKKERGFGLRCKEAIAAGSFVIEYVGEVIDSVEFQRRMQQKSNDRDENYYFLYVEKDYIVDAGPKGNMARFMNHSCDPNCETQKWSVNGLNRVGLFAIKDIPAETELTFNYHWDELLGNDKKACYCGSENCTGQIGKVSKDVKSKQLSVNEEPANVNSRNIKIDQTKMPKIRKRNKKTTSKILNQRSSKDDGQATKKPKILRKKKYANNSGTERNESKSTE